MHLYVRMRIHVLDVYMYTLVRTVCIYVFVHADCMYLCSVLHVCISDVVTVVHARMYDSIDRLISPQRLPLTSERR